MKGTRWARKGVSRDGGRCIYHRGYAGLVEFSQIDEVFYGKVIGIKALLTFEGDTVCSLIADFRSAVDEYLEFCDRFGVTPEKTFEGSFSVRIGPESHRIAAESALDRGISLNAFIEEVIRQSVALNI